MVFAVIVVICLLASVPPISRDALIHHLTIPKLYLKHGGIYEIQELKFSYYPMNLDLLYLVPLYFKNDIFPKFIHFGFALITAVMIYKYLSRRINREYALLGALFFLSIPVITRLSSIAYVDLGLICFLFASLLYVFRWIESEFQLKYLAISAIFCGLGLGTKYNGLIGLFLLGLFIPFVYTRYHAGKNLYSTKAVSWGAVFVFIALTVFSPWMIRNIIWTGNPVYPLYNGFFNNEKNIETILTEHQNRKSARMSHFEIRKNLYGETTWEIAMLPIRVFFQGRDNDPKFFDGKANPFLLLLPVFAFLGFKRETRQLKTEKMLMLFFSICFLLFACAQTSIRIRYFSPIIPPLVILSMFGLSNISCVLLNSYQRVSQHVKKIIIFLIIFVMLGLNATYIISRFEYIRPIAYLSGKISRDSYIQRFWPEYAAMRYANEHLPKDAKIMGVYMGNRGYYLDVPIIFGLNMLQRLSAKAASPEEVVQMLREKKISHLLVNYELFNFWVKNYSRHEKRVLKDFFENYTATMFSKDGYGLLQVTLRPES